jgi:FtsH-binding integral membrane protein
MATFKTDVWNRVGRYNSVGGDISANVFNLVITFTVMFGLALYGVMANAFATTKFGGWTSLFIFLGTLAGCFVAANDFAPAKIIGLSMISGGLGTLSGSFYHQFTKGSILNVILMVAAITILFGAIGTLIPQSLASWGGTLLTLLTAFIIAQLVCVFFLPTYQARTFFDWCGVLLFSGYIVFDFNRAQNVEKTVENGMDCGISIFLDIANLLVYLMELFGQKDSDD